MSGVSIWSDDVLLAPLDVPVLVTDGDAVGIDRLVLHYEVDGRVLLPSDPRRRDMDPEIRWERWTNVAHWMPLPAPP
jgi:hypothetical protein